MIISKQKPFDEILLSINHRPVFIIGCSECASLCQVGGEREVFQMKHRLEDEGITVSGWVILDPACHYQNNRRLFKPVQKQLDAAAVILVLACGNGVQTVAEFLDEKEIVTGTHTLFLGEIKRLNDFDRRCNLCGVCIVDQFQGICPIARCPKQMLNGPCGGAHEGTCEVDDSIACVWQEILEKRRKDDDLYLKIIPPHDWSQSQRMKQEPNNE